MRIISRYIVSQVWTPAALAAVLVTFILLAGGIQRNLGDLLAKVPFVQLSIVDVAFIAVFSLPTALGLILPLTFMFGVMFAYGRLAKNSELTAMRACGISLKQAVVPVLFFGAAVSVFCFALQNVAQPWAVKHLSHLLTYDLPLRMTLDMLPTGVMHNYGDWRVYIGSRDEDATLRDIMLLQPEGSGGVNAFYADTARVEAGPEGSRIVMQKGHLIPASEGFEVRRISFDTLAKAVPRPAARAPLAAYTAMSAGELIDLERATTQQYEQTGAITYLPELHDIRWQLSDRISLPALAFVLGLLAAPIGARTSRHGSSWSFAIGIGVTAAYFVLASALNAVYYLPLPAALALGQVPNLLFLALGGVLLLRVDRV
jgi:lipopolysaccharide export LptBFGC system permease protein LptF